MMGKANTKNEKIPKLKSYFLPLASCFSTRKAQVTLEFAFCMIILFLMMYGIIMVFRWVGLDLGQRQQAHQAVLEQDIDTKYGQCAAWDYTDPLNPICTDFRNVARGPLTQIDPFFYEPGPMNAVWAGD